MIRRALFVIGVLLVLGGLGAAGGAYPAYNRIVFGAPPLVLGLVCLAAAGRRRTAVVSLLLAALVVVIWLRPSIVGAAPRPHASMARIHMLLTRPVDQLRHDLFNELQPVDLPGCRIERWGGPNDGGYLMCGNLTQSVKAGYSYGIGAADTWGCDVATRLGVTVHQYDCFDPQRPSCSGGTTVFHNECIAGSRFEDNGRLFDTLENQLARNGDGAHHVIVKMDVEGAEWDSLLTAPAGVLERIDQLAMELHGVGSEKHVAAIRRLKQYFHVAHLHFNNQACMRRIDPFPAYTYEVLLVNKRLTTAGAARPRGPHPLDEPSDPDLADCQTPAPRWSLR